MLLQSRQAIALALISPGLPQLICSSLPNQLMLQHEFVMSHKLTKSVDRKELFARSLFGALSGAFTDITTWTHPPAQSYLIFPCQLGYLCVFPVVSLCSVREDTDSLVAT
jgi:hypothetical protein